MSKWILGIILSIFMAPCFAQLHVVLLVSEKDDSKFYVEPKELTIKSGDTVKWVNLFKDAHNVVADSVPKGAESFKSPMLTKAGQSWSFTFKQSGTYSYHCHPHASYGMKGTIIVDRPSTEDEKSSVHDGHDHAHHNH